VPKFVGVRDNHTSNTNKYLNQFLDKANYILYSNVAFLYIHSLDVYVE